MHTPFLIFTLWLSVFAPAASAQFTLPIDQFEPEVGASIALTSGAQMPVWMPGMLRVHFIFYSDLPNPQGGYFEPDLNVAYSVRAADMTASECSTFGLNWVHGQDGRWPDVEVLQFSPSTGQGLAKALLPINRLDDSGTWGTLMLDATAVKVYWGWHSQDLIHAGTSEPLTYEGVKSLTLVTYEDPIYVEIIQNRMMFADHPCEVRLNVSATDPADRVFSVYSEVPDLFECPSTVTLPADMYHVTFLVTPRQLGSGRIVVVPQGDSSATYSQIGAVQVGPEGYPWDGDDPFEEPQFPSTPIRMNSDCHHAKVISGKPVGATKTVCGECKSGNHSSLECFPGGTAGAYYVIPFYCDWFSLFNNCVHDANGAQVPVQKFSLVEEWIEQCGTSSSGTTAQHDKLVFWDSSTTFLFRQCCKIVATSDSKTITINDCN